MNAEAETGLVGLAYHTFKPCPSAQHMRIQWQGRVVGRHGDYYVIETMDWLTGYPFNRLVVNVAEFTNRDKWWFYEDVEAMVFHYEHRYTACKCEADQ